MDTEAEEADEVAKKTKQLVHLKLNKIKAAREAYGQRLAQNLGDTLPPAMDQRYPQQVRGTQKRHDLIPGHDQDHT